MSDGDEQKEMDKKNMEKYGLQADQIAELKECYALFDKGDEGVAVKDIGDVLRAMGQNPTEEQCNEMISDAQTLAENGILTMDDFISIAGPKLQPEEEMEDNLEEAFKVFDRLGTGYVDVEEMRQKLLTLGEVLDEEDINEMFKVAEVDKKGRIMYYDFVKKMTAK